MEVANTPFTARTAKNAQSADLSSSRKRCAEFTPLTEVDDNGETPGLRGRSSSKRQAAIKANFTKVWLRAAEGPAAQRHQAEQKQQGGSGCDGEWAPGLEAEMAAAGLALPPPPPARVSAFQMALKRGEVEARYKPVSQEELDQDEQRLPRQYGAAGQLVRVRLVNFMCHQHMELQLGRHVTFLSGTNGSGKSAVLQAIQACLGVKASQTGRASNLQQFIRAGCDYATVAVTLWNIGADAFHPEFYGNQITIERHIGRNSKVLVKDQEGRVMASRRDAVDEILAHMDLHAANPVAVLTQDTARQFLCGSSASGDRAKYELFMRATYLQQTADNYRAVQGTVAQMGALLLSTKRQLVDKMKEKERLASGLREVKQAEGWELELEGLLRAAAWSEVQRFEDGIQELGHVLSERAPQEAQDLRQRLEAAQHLEQRMVEEFETKRSGLEGYVERSEQLLDQQAGLKAEAKAARGVAQRVQREVNRLDKLIQQAAEFKQAREDLEHQADEARGGLTKLTQRVVEEYQARLEAVRVRAEQAAEQAEKMRRANRLVGEQLPRLFREVDDLKRRSRNIEYETRRHHRDLAELKGAAASRVAQWGGQQAAVLVEALQRNACLFQRPPIGPLGAHLTLKDTRHAAGVSAAIGHALRGFIVHCAQDAAALRDLARRVGVERLPPMTVYSFDLPPHVIPEDQRPPAGHVTTVLDVLAASDELLHDVIMNVLIDQAKIERIALCNTDREAEEAAFHTHNVIAAYTPDGAKRYTRGSAHTYMGASARSWAPRLGADVRAQAKELERHLEGLQEQQRDLDQRVCSSEQQLHDTKERHMAGRQALAQALRKEARLQSHVTFVESQPPPEAAMAVAAADGGGGGSDDWGLGGGGGCSEEEAQARALAAQLEEVARQLWDLRAERRGAVARLEAARDVERETQARHEAKRNEVVSLQQDNVLFQEHVGSHTQRIADQKRAVEAARQAVENHEAAASRLEEQLSDAKDRLRDLVCGAEGICSREESRAALEEVRRRLREDSGWSKEQVEAAVTHEGLHRQIARTEAKIRQHDKAVGGRPDQLQAQHERACREVERVQQDFRPVRDCYKRMHRMLHDGRERLERIQRRVEDEVSTQFNRYMSRKGHMGSVRLVHPTGGAEDGGGRLEISVVVGGAGARVGGGGAGGGGEAGGEGSRRQVVTDLKQLSGGERSFATVAFILSAGSFVSTPWRAMDEFDVFLDSVNRRTCLANLLEFAQARPEHQFLLLTPQDIAAVEDARSGLNSHHARRHPGNPPFIPDGFVGVKVMRPARP